MHLPLNMSKTRERLTSLMEDTGINGSFPDDDYSFIRVSNMIGSKVPVSVGFRHDKVQLILLYARFQNSTKSDLVRGQPIYKWFVLICHLDVPKKVSITH